MLLSRFPELTAPLSSSCASPLTVPASSLPSKASPAPPFSKTLTIRSSHCCLHHPPVQHSWLSGLCPLKLLQGYSESHPPFPLPSSGRVGGLLWTPPASFSGLFQIRPALPPSPQALFLNSCPSSALLSPLATSPHFSRLSQSNFHSVWHALSPLPSAMKTCLLPSTTPVTCWRP